MEAYHTDFSSLLRSEPFLLLPSLDCTRATGARILFRRPSWWMFFRRWMLPRPTCEGLFSSATTLSRPKQSPPRRLLATDPYERWRSLDRSSGSPPQQPPPPSTSSFDGLANRRPWETELRQQQRHPYSPSFYQMHGSPSDFQQRRKLLLWSVVILGAGTTVYVVTHLETVPVTGRRRFMDVSPEEELRLGEAHYQQMLRLLPVLSQSDFHTKKVREVGLRLASETGIDISSFEFTVAVDNTVNAMCLPGGKVLVNTGLFAVCRSDDELAVVLGHEIAHAVCRHGAERLSWAKILRIVYFGLALLVGGDVPFLYNIITAIAFDLPNSRNMETEADYAGLLLMAKACYDPRVAPEVFRKLERSSRHAGMESSALSRFLSTHPLPEDRSKFVVEHIDEAVAVRSEHCQDSLRAFRRRLF